MGVLCSCTQTIIYIKQNQEVDINSKFSSQKNISSKNLKSKYKEKYLTKDSTLVNNSINNNSPDFRESNKNLTKHNITEEKEPQSNLNKEEKLHNQNCQNINEIKKNITQNEAIDKENLEKRKNNLNLNNILVISPGLNTISPNSFPSSQKVNKLDKFLNLTPNGKGNGEGGEKNMIGFRADSFNIINPIKTILTNKSNIATKNSPKKQLITNKTIDETNNQDRKNFKLSYSIKTNAVFGKESQKLLIYYLHKHFMIMEYSDEFINYLMDYINVLKYKNREVIFKKGEVANNFYLIKQGLVMLVSNGKVFKKLNAGNTFGEISLFQNEKYENNDNNDNDDSNINNNDILVRNYTAVSSGKTELYVIKNTYYNFGLKVLSSKLKTIDYNEDENEIKERNKGIIENYKFFKYLDSEKRNLILRMAKIFHFKEEGKLLTISNYNRKGNTLIDNKPYFRSMQSLIFPIDGEIIELSENLSYRKKISKNDCSGIIPVLYPKIKNQIYTKTGQENTKILYIPEEILIEVLGPNYSREIIKQYFIHHFFEQNILSIFLNININENNKEVNDLDQKDKKKINEVFNTFLIKGYEKGEIIYHHQNNMENKKLIFPIIYTNMLIYELDNKKKEIKETFLIEDIFNDYNPTYNIKTDNIYTIVLETKWKNIYEYFYLIKNEYADIIKRFNIYKDMITFRPLYTLSVEQLINFGLNAEIKEYKPKEIIINNNEKNNIFYLIFKGRVKTKNPETNKTLRVYEEGNCFGDYYILTENISNKIYISNDYTKCYCIDEKTFYEYLKIPTFNDYIKRKILLEDEETKLNEFYYISYLGKGAFGYVCLVHNELSFYAIKAINRDAAEKGKNGIKNLVNEKKCMIAIDHPFIINFVKTMKNNNWVFILEEYINGKSFEDYLMNRKTYKNIKELMFYSGCLFHMLRYLTKRRICHRDIKPRNIMIGTDGYLKLLDFGCARKIKLFSNTIVGTPNYISPEVLKGIEYSFTCDYWSVGVCCYLIYFGYLPFGDKSDNVMQIYKEIIKGKINIPKDCPLMVKDLIEGLLRRNAAERINNFDKVKACEIFKDFDWDNLLKKKLEPFFICGGVDLGGKANLKNLASPFEKFIQNEWVETSEMHLLKIKNKQIDNNMEEEFQKEFINNESDMNNENDVEFSNNWYEYF
jgi:cGMP-dependent protein kinase